MPDDDDKKPDDDGDEKPDPKTTVEYWKAQAAEWKEHHRKLTEKTKADAKKLERLAELEDSQKTAEEKAATKLKELEDKETAANQRVQAAERRALILSVAQKKGLSPTLTNRLQGETEEELEDDADELLSAFKGTNDNNAGGGRDNVERRPREGLRSGASGPPPNPDEDPAKIAEAVLKG